MYLCQGREEEHQRYLLCTTLSSPCPLPFSSIDPVAVTCCSTGKGSGESRTTQAQCRHGQKQVMIHTRTHNKNLNIYMCVYAREAHRVQRKKRGQVRGARNTSSQRSYIEVRDFLLGKGRGVEEENVTCLMRDELTR